MYKNCTNKQERQQCCLLSLLYVHAQIFYFSTSHPLIKNIFSALSACAIFQKKFLPVKPFAVILFFLAGCVCAGCHHPARQISFYYWRTQFAPDSTEQQAIRYNSVQTLYTRFFDVDFLPADTSPIAVSPLKIDAGSITTGMVPVVYIRNRVFERLDTNRIAGLCKKVHDLVTAISRTANIHAASIQFDCDWTLHTRYNYFLFLQQYKKLSKEIITATIRLHQVKYAATTGIPPVDGGILMYYNMGDINAGTTNSIYDKSIAARYIPSLQTYPLPLDIALPLFAWGLQLRAGKVVKLLNKMNFRHFQNDTNFIATGKDRYTAQHACFHGGYYFMENDSVKTEQVTEKDLLDITAQINRYSNKRIGNLLFYDLDTENLVLYDKNIFRKMLDSID